jgi:hypothetical protein
MKTTFIFLIIALVCHTQFSTAATFTWNGSVDTVFAKKANWTTANGTTYPGSNDTIYIVAATNRPVLASDRDVARLVLTSGSMDLKGYTFTATLSALCTIGTVDNGTLVVRGTKAQFSGSTINTTLDVYCDEIIFDGGIFNESCVFTTTGIESSVGSGGCVFNNVVTIIHQGNLGKKFVLSQTTPATFNNVVTFTNTGNGLISIEPIDSTMFNGNVKLNNTGSGSICITNALLTSGNSIMAGDSGFQTGKLFLSYFYQKGSTTQTLTLTDNSSLLLRACEFNGSSTFTAPNIICGHSVFNGTTQFIKTATSGNYWNGNNVFDAATTITYQGTGGTAGDELRLANVLPNTYHDDVTFESDGNPLQVVCNSSSNFYGNITTNHRAITFRKGETIFNGGNAQELNSTVNFDFEEVQIDKTDR